jgi:hypothetical protein
MRRRDFISGGLLAAAGAAGCATANETAVAAEPMPIPEGDGIKALFLGSGASGWKPEWAAKNPHMRRQSSVLLDGRVLIDFTSCGFDKLPEGCRPEALFQTHSHGDHYSPYAAVKSGVARMYVHETWAATARRHVAAAAEKLGMRAPEVIPLSFGTRVVECGLAFTAVPANHSTSRVTDGELERTCLYLVEKGATRLLYATDTAGIPGDSARMIGIDPHIREENYERFSSSRFVHRPQAITALVMEATDGDSDENFRMFVHSGVPTVARTVRMLTEHKRYLPPEGQKVYLTHFGIKYRDMAAEEVNKFLPEPLNAAYDGLEVVFR